jgi:replicative DNA helicase
MSGDKTNAPTVSLPYAPDAEKGVLCSLILLPDKVSELCADRLQTEAFWVPAHKIIYDSVMQFGDKSKQHSCPRSILKKG